MARFVLAVTLLLIATAMQAPEMLVVAIALAIFSTLDDPAAKKPGGR